MWGIGQFVLGHGWHLGDAGQSCTEVCSAAGRTHDPATGTVAGSWGIDASGMAVLKVVASSLVGCCPPPWPLWTAPMSAGSGASSSPASWQLLELPALRQAA